MEQLEGYLVQGFEILSKAFATNVWLGVGMTVCFIGVLIALRIISKKKKWQRDVKAGKENVNDSVKEGKDIHANVSSGDDWNPSK